MLFGNKNNGKTLKSIKNYGFFMADIDYESLVDFSKLKECITKKKTASKYVAADVGITQSKISAIITGWVFPKTDILARIAWALNVPVSEVVDFKGIEPNAMQTEWFASHKREYTPPDESKGELTYAPLWELIDGFLAKVNDGKTDGLKNANDLLDSIEPYRRRNGLVSGLGEEALKASLKSRGIEKGYTSSRERHYKAKGLTPETRTKLRNDRPLSIRTIYDICHKLGCSVDWVLSYK